MKYTNLFHLIICVSLCSCSHVSSKATFDLSSVQFDKNTKKYFKRNIQLLIAEPNSTRFYDSDNIIVKTTPNNLSYLGNSQWADRLPNLIQNRLIESFENSNFFKAVDRPGQRMAFDYELITNIRNFNVYVLDNATAAQISIDAKILNERTGKVKATHIFNANEILPIDSSMAKKLSPNYYALRLDTAFKKLAKEIILWARKYS